MAYLGTTLRPASRNAATLGLILMILGWNVRVGPSNYPHLFLCKRISHGGQLVHLVVNVILQERQGQIGRSAVPRWGHFYPPPPRKGHLVLKSCSSQLGENSDRPPTPGVAPTNHLAMESSPQPSVRPRLLQQGAHGILIHSFPSYARAFWVSHPIQASLTSC
jgi:hypothetical protein